MSAEEAYADQAKKLVDDVIEASIKRLETGIALTEREKTFESIIQQSETSPENTFVRDENFVVENIKWLTIGDYSVAKAEEKMHEYIKTWQYDVSWLYCIDFLGAEEYDFDSRYRFRVRWSIPTRRKPIPRATASVYFSFVVSKIKPKHYPVDTYYVYETHKLVHKPGQSRFREKWLKDIIENKVMMMQMVEF
ncbi:A-kinase anchor protein 14-like [Mytilus galloprovincialis]|uniref:A-kinase anchor protein 14 n=1 Tax=Mytilus galloprovincialis TaxID=29158 RepID=A0A8B6G407_MYTGA|nr:A-kinase anchor protein 14 [Mytilus galloprovincialis]